MVETTSMQPVAFVAIVGPRRAFSICLYVMVAPHPAHARCPGIKTSGFSAKSLIVNFHSGSISFATFSLPQPDELDCFSNMSCFEVLSELSVNFIYEALRHVPSPKSVDVVDYFLAGWAIVEDVAYLVEHWSSIGSEAVAPVHNCYGFHILQCFSYVLGWERSVG